MQRDKKREKIEGNDVIPKMHRQHLIKNNSEGPKYDKKQPIYRDQDPSLPIAIICDLDGTLALLNGRSPFDASKCNQDLPNIPVVNMVKNYYQLT